MPNWSDPGDDKETCDCTFGSECDYHAKQHEYEDRRYREESIRKGINPDAQVTEDLCELLFALERCDSLSRRQKDAIQRIIFPL